MNELNLEKQLNSPSQKFAKIIHYLKAKLRNEKKIEVRYLEKYIKPHSIIFDIGAQFGQYSKQFANLHGGSCKVFSFEPFNYSRDILNKVISNKKNVKVFSNGFSNKNTISSIFIPIKKSGKLGPGLSNLGDKIHINFVRQEVQLKTIDDLEYEFFIYEKDLIQVDGYKKPTDYLFVPK